MKLGVENSKKVVIAVALMVFALALFVFMVAGGNAPRVALGPAVSGPPQVTGRMPVNQIFDPSVRAEALAASESLTYTGKGPNLFRNQPDPPPPPTCAPLGASSRGLRYCSEVIVPDRPKPAEIPLIFFGFASKSGEPKEVFLSHNQDLFVAREGDIVDRRYKIMHINPRSVEVQDLLDADAQPQTLGLKT
jgi:hypothetical protein